MQWFPWGKQSPRSETECLQSESTSVPARWEPWMARRTSPSENPSAMQSQSSGNPSPESVRESHPQTWEREKESQSSPKAIRSGKHSLRREETSPRSEKGSRRWPSGNRSEKGCFSSAMGSESRSRRWGSQTARSEGKCSPWRWEMSSAVESRPLAIESETRSEIPRRPWEGRCNQSPWVHGSGELGKQCSSSGYPWETRSSPKAPESGNPWLSLGKKSQSTEGT